jgi:hypothetical protein
MPGEGVLLRIYHLLGDHSRTQELSREALGAVGLGIYHGGIEVYGREYSFGGFPTGTAADLDRDGIFRTLPRSRPNFKVTIPLGETMLTEDDVRHLVNSMRPQWKAHMYHAVHKNCHDFCKEFAKGLGPGLADHIPHWVNRAARSGARLVPDALIERLSPHLSIPETLTGRIGVPNKGPAPEPLPDPLLLPPLDRSGRHSDVSGSRSHRRHLRSTGGPLEARFTAAFPSLASESIVADHRCHALYMGQSQSGHLLLTDQHLCFLGAKGARDDVALDDVVSIRYHRECPGLTFEVLPLNALAKEATGISVFTTTLVYRLNGFHHGPETALHDLYSLWKHPANPSGTVRPRFGLLTP